AGGGESAGAAQADVQAEIVHTRKLIERRRTPVILRLEHKGGFPVMAEELHAEDAAPVEVFVVDAALSDFHHEEPHAMEKPGEYIFTLTPRTPCGYRVWAGLKPASQPYQFVTVDL